MTTPSVSRTETTPQIWLECSTAFLQAGNLCKAAEYLDRTQNWMHEHPKSLSRHSGPLRRGICAFIMKDLAQMQDQSAAGQDKGPPPERNQIVALVSGHLLDLAVHDRPAHKDWVGIALACTRKLAGHSPWQAREMAERGVAVRSHSQPAQKELRQQLVELLPRGFFIAGSTPATITRVCASIRALAQTQLFRRDPELALQYDNAACSLYAGQEWLQEPLLHLRLQLLGGMPPDHAATAQLRQQLRRTLGSPQEDGAPCVPPTQAMRVLAQVRSKMPPPEVSRSADAHTRWVNAQYLRCQRATAARPD